MPDEIKTWANTVGQQIEKMTVDLVAQTAAGVSEASGDVFFVGRPAQNGQDWILKKITPTELNKMVYNYLTSNSVAQLLAQVLGVPSLIADSDITDIDNVSYSYIWTRFASTAPSGTFPSGFSTVGSFFFHVAISSRNKVQAIINYDCSHVFVRTWWGTLWQEWKTIV